MNEAYCVKCRKKVEIQNLKEELIDTNRGKKIILKGKCPICGTNLSRFMGAPKKEPQKSEKEDYEFDSPKSEKEQVREFREKANNNEILKRNKIKPVRSDYYNLLKFLVIIFGIAVVVFGYVAYTDKLAGNVDCGNHTCPECPVCPTCPECSPTTNCNPSLVCPNISCNFPEIKIVNGSEE